MISSKPNHETLTVPDLQKMVSDLVKANAFTSRKLCDTPTDALSVVNLKYVTLNGPSTSRPTASVIGQQYFDTTLAAGNGKPVWWNGTGFVDATGTFV
jgi:hypothetical protein